LEYGYVSLKNQHLQLRKTIQIQNDDQNIVLYLTRVHFSNIRHFWLLCCLILMIGLFYICVCFACV